ncbi:MbnP family protein [Tenacibaculum salmonis]|uniref:MbnP family protein n=1 Tax=Tenacibaculum sp. P3-BQ1 TaxID=3232310 RepID=UPI0034DE709D
MKQFSILLLSLFIFSCSSDNDEPIKEVAIQVNFSQNWDGTTIEKSDLSNTEFSYIIGTDIKTETTLKIDKLRYLISKITLTDGAGKATTFDGYQLVDLSNSESSLFNPSVKISEGNYNLSMTFGFNEDDNIDGNYADLNTASWGVPMMLGGGYHFMQMDGKYKDTKNVENPYNFHTIRAYNTETKKAEDTSFSVDLGSINVKNNATIEIKMNVAQWFKNPNDWDLNKKNISLMMDYEAQKTMSENGKKGVFSLGTITQ